MANLQSATEVCLLMGHRQCLRSFSYRNLREKWKITRRQTKLIGRCLLRWLPANTVKYSQTRSTFYSIRRCKFSPPFSLVALTPTPANVSLPVRTFAWIINYRYSSKQRNRFFGLSVQMNFWERTKNSYSLTRYPLNGKWMKFQVENFFSLEKSLAFWKKNFHFSKLRLQMEWFFAFRS